MKYLSRRLILAVIVCSTLLLVTPRLSHAGLITPVDTLLAGWENPRSMAIAGDYLYLLADIAGQRSIIVFDVSDSTAPKRVHSYPILSTFLSIYTGDSTHFYLLSPDSVVTYGLENPLEPTSVGHYPAPNGKVIQHAVFRNQIGYIYVGQDGYYIVSFAQPALPTLLSSFFQENVLRTSISGDYLSVILDTGTVNLIDISAPESPRLPGMWQIPVDGWGMKAKIEYTLTIGSDLYVCGRLIDYFAGHDPCNYPWLYRLDLSTFEVKDSLLLEGISEWGTWDFGEPFCKAGKLFLPVGVDDWFVNSFAMKVFDVADSSGIVEIAETVIANSTPGLLAVSDTKIYSTAGYDGYHQLPIFTTHLLTDIPILLGSYSEEGGAVYNLTVQEPYVLVQNWTGLRIYDCTKPRDPRLLHTLKVEARMGNIYMMGHQGYFYLSYLTPDNQPYFLSISPELGIVDSLSLTNINTVCAIDQYLYIWGKDTLTTVCVKNPDSMQVVSVTDYPRLNHSYRTLAVAGQYLYGLVDGKGVDVFLLSPQEKPTYLGLEKDMLTNFFANAFPVGDRLICGGPHQELIQYDITNPKQPKRVDFKNKPGTGSIRSANGNSLVIYDRGRGFRIVDFSCPDEPRGIDSVNKTPGYLWVVEAGVKYLYAADESSFTIYDGSQVLSVTPLTQTPTHPSSFSLSQNFPNPFNSSTVISYSLPQSAQVTVTIHDLNGREIKRPLESTNQSAGAHSVSIDAGDLPAGCYFYRVKAEGMVKVKKMVVLR